MEGIPLPLRRGSVGVGVTRGVPFYNNEIKGTALVKKIDIESFFFLIEEVIMVITREAHYEENEDDRNSGFPSYISPLWKFLCPYQ